MNSVKNKIKMKRCNVTPGKSALVIFVVFVLFSCECQREPSLPLSSNSFNQIIRSTINVPIGRSASVKNIMLRFYGSNSTCPSTSVQLHASKKLLAAPGFDPTRPTVVYAHGYVELTTDASVRTIVRAYLQNGHYNILVVDWANLAFGNYALVALDVPTVGKEIAIGLLKLIKHGLPISNIHLVGHSMGAHVLAYAARYLAARGHTVHRLTGLDPAFPGYYPALLGAPVSARDALFVDVVHTDGGGYGAPGRSAHADFWPNGGAGKQPGCLPRTLLFTTEDFCSHWRSWAFWAESVAGGRFVARPCDSYDAFLRRACRDSPLVDMGLRAAPDLRGNFYLRTATREPYSLGVAGAD